MPPGPLGTGSAILSLAVLLLAALAAGCGDQGSGPDDPHDHGEADGNCGHLVASGYLLQTDGSTLVHGWRGTQTGSIALREGELGPATTLTFIDADSVVFGVADNCTDNSLGIEIGDPTVLELARETGVEWTFRLRGLRAGSTTLTLRGMHEGHSHVGTLPIPVTVESATSAGLALTGQLELAVTLVAEFGDSLGRQTYGDETGVRVYLERPDGSLDSTSTEAGAFHFAGLGDGLHRVWSGPPEARSPVREITLAGQDVDLGTLNVGPIGRLRTPPNPFPYSHGTGVEWDLAASESVEIRIFSASARRVWTYAYDAPFGFQHIHWIGTDQANLPLPPGPYWIAVHYEGRWHSRVVIKLPE